MIRYFLLCKMKSNKPLLRTYCLRCRKHTYNLLPQKVMNKKVIRNDSNRGEYVAVKSRLWRRKKEVSAPSILLCSVQKKYRE